MSGGGVGSRCAGGHMSQVTGKQLRPQIHQKHYFISLVAYNRARMEFIFGYHTRSSARQVQLCTCTNMGEDVQFCFGYLLAPI